MAYSTDPNPNDPHADDTVNGDRAAARLAAYAELRRARPGLFADPPGSAYALELGEAEQREVAERQRAIMRRDGLPADYGDVGVVYADGYIKLVRDAVRFRDGRLASYIRMMSAGESNGAAVLPIVDGAVVLVRHFRHAVRDWLWEMPRGFPEPGERPADTAERELAEELRLAVAELIPLGELHPDAGISSVSVPLFAARATGTPEPDPIEGIDDVRLLRPAELGAWIAEGRITDAFTLAACAIARARGLI